jgi:NADPH:quinone reductase-like Zn-dependent oxidoreductase
MQAIVVDELGGPDVLRPTGRPSPLPGAGEILVDISAAGVNFMDTATRRFGPPGVGVPFVPGVEGAGRVTGLGEGVTDFAVGDRVAWVYAYGTYADQITLPETSAVPLPEFIADEVAASVMMQGLTAHHFATEAAPVRSGDVTLVHAAAGGLGQLLTQLIKLRGGVVIGLVSRDDKVDVARRAGADHVLVSTGDQFVSEVLELTHGEGVQTVFDGGGETTFHASTRVTRRHGTVLYYGTVIGQTPTVNMVELPKSIKVCYPTFFDHIPTRDALLSHSAEIFRLIESGDLKVNVGHRYPLSQAAQAHFDIESRRTTGKLLLVP